MGSVLSNMMQGVEIPAFAGMTFGGCGNDVGVCGKDVGVCGNDVGVWE